MNNILLALRSLELLKIVGFVSLCDASFNYHCHDSFVWFLCLFVRPLTLSHFGFTFFSRFIQWWSACFCHLHWKSIRLLVECLQSLNWIAPYCTFKKVEQHLVSSFSICWPNLNTKKNLSNFPMVSLAIVVDVVFVSFFIFCGQYTHVALKWSFIIITQMNSDLLHFISDWNVLSLTQILFLPRSFDFVGYYFIGYVDSLPCFGVFSNGCSHNCWLHQPIVKWYKHKENKSYLDAGYLWPTCIVRI